MPLEAAMFDFDGTLVDSLPGIEHSVDHALHACGCAPRACEVRPLIGPPIRSILSRITGETAPERLNALEAAFRSSYDSDGWQRTFFFEGARETLETLASAGVSLFVVTNKPEQATTRILGKAGLQSLFTDVVCRNSSGKLFRSKAEMVAHVLFLHRLSPEVSVFIGDTAEDYEAATAAGVPVVLVQHGYGYSHDGESVPHCSWIPTLSQLTGILDIRSSA